MVKGCTQEQRRERVLSEIRLLAEQAEKYIAVRPKFKDKTLAFVAAKTEELRNKLNMPNGADDCDDE